MKFTLSIFVTLAVAAGISVAQDASPSAAKDAFDRAKLPEELHLKEFKPKAVLAVVYPGSPQPGSQSPPPAIPLEHGGAQLPENSTPQTPTFSHRVPGKPVDIGSGPFVIAIVDPDAPASEKSPIGHFLGANFKFKDDGVSLVNTTPAVMEYKPPSPPAQGSEPHKFVFLLFKQSDGFKEKELGSIDPATFNVSQFAEKFGLGSPLGGTYMLGPQKQEN